MQTSRAVKLGIVLGVVVLLVIIGVLIWYFILRKNTNTATTREFKVSATVGDFIELTEKDGLLTYTNRTNGTSGVDVKMTTDDRGIVTFGDDPNLVRGVMTGSMFFLHGNTLGPQKSKKGFALGMKVKPYTTPNFPPRLLNYMQFRTNNNGFEVGFIDAKGSELVHQHYFPADFERSGIAPATAFQIDASTFALSADSTHLTKTFAATVDEPENTVTIFQSETDDVVIDMQNGSIYAFSAPDTEPALPTGVYTGLLFGRDDAVAHQDNTETGTDILSHVSIVFSAEGKFTWTEEGTLRHEGTIVPLHTLVTLDGGRKMFGTYLCNLTNADESQTKLAFVHGAGGKLLCGEFTSTPQQTSYKYRHGACAIDV